MTDQTIPPNDQPGSTGPAADQAKTGSGGTTASSVVDSLRDAFEELAERAGPTVKEFSAKAAEITAAAADKAAPLARKAGEVAAEASGKLADRSRGWAHDLREAVDGSEGTPANAGDAARDATDRAADTTADTTADSFDRAGDTLGHVGPDTSDTVGDAVDDASAGR
jgi:hypothetical protein